MNTSFFNLNVKKVVQETDDAVSLYFDVPESEKETFNFVQGQHLTLKFTIGGEDVRRAYSICTSPLEGELAVTVKQVPKGLVST